MCMGTMGTGMITGSIYIPFHFLDDRSILFLFIIKGGLPIVHIYHMKIFLKFIKMFRKKIISDNNQSTDAKVKRQLIVTMSGTRY